MIGTNLPPGTEIVCINANRKAFHIPGVKYDTNSNFDLVEGQVYTIKEYEERQGGAHKGKIVVVLNEITRPATHENHTRGFNRARFRRLHLPDSILECLNVKQKELTSS